MFVYLILPSTGCPDDLRITETALNELMPINYTPEELRACLKNVSAKNYFAKMLDYPFSQEQLVVLKEKLDEVTSG